MAHGIYIYILYIFSYSENKINDKRNKGGFTITYNSIIFFIIHITRQTDSQYVKEICK